MRRVYFLSRLRFVVLALVWGIAVSACVKDSLDNPQAITDTTEPVHWLAGSTIQVERTTNIDGPSLIIDAGVTIKCAPGTNLSIGTIKPVRIVINGTAEAPVVIQGEGMGASCNGLLIDMAAPGSRISNLRLEDVYSTLEHRAAMVVKKLNFAIYNLSIESDTNGLWVERLGNGGMLSGLNVSCGGEAPLACPIQGVESLAGLGLSSSADAPSVLLLPPAEKIAAVRLPKLSYPYCIDQVISIDAPTFQVASGTTIYFKMPGILDFGCFEPCTLNCQGVRFIKHPALFGQQRWAGISFNARVTAESLFTGCTIAGAEVGAIFENARRFRFMNNTIRDCRVGVKAYSSLLHSLASSNTFTGNVKDTEATRGQRGAGLRASR